MTFCYPPSYKGLKGVLEILMELSDKMKSALLAVLFEKATLKIFWEIPIKPIIPKCILKVHNYAEYELYVFLGIS